MIATFDPATTKSVLLSIDLAAGTASIDVIPVEAASVPGPATAPVPAIPKPAALFSAQSPWNSRPVKPVLGKDTVPAAKQTPWIEEGAYASKIYRAAPADSPTKVMVADIANQLDGGAVTIPHFPAGVIPATGQDGHCEILDGDALHSFYQLKNKPTGWSAQKYARTSATGSGFGTVANPDNVRAAGCSTAGGLLLASERGLAVVPHALAIGMDKNGIAAGPVFPATMQDFAGGYTGKFPIGSLMMLPATFDADALSTPELRAIARTLMTYGGYLVDATVGSLNIYAEIGSGWANGSAGDLQTIKAALRQVVSQSGWVDRDGVAYAPQQPRSTDLLSMRGPWEGYNGSKAFGRYDAASDLLQAESTTDERTIRQLLYTHDEADRFAWKKQCWNLNPEPGVKYLVRAVGDGDITATLAVKQKDYKANYGSTGKIAPGKSAVFTWPTDPGTVTEVYVDKPKGAMASIRLELVKV